MSTDRVRVFVRAILAGAPLLAVCTAHAQSATSAKADADADSAGAAQLQEVVVTAARRTQNLQKVSAAVSVVQGTQITQQGLTNVAQIVQQLPSVQATGQPGGFSIDIRGQGGDLPAGTQQGSVALEFDGIYNINSQATTVGFFDVNRIEVLAGPQSTRYGPDADGGVVNVITNDPVLGSASGSGSITVGNYGLLRTEFAQNIPLGEKLAARVAVATINRNSYFTPAEGNAVAQSVRAKVLYQPTDDLSLKLQYQLDHIGGTGSGSNIFPVLTSRVPPYLNDSINQYGNPWENGDIPSNGLGAGQDQADLYQQTAVLDAKAGLDDWAAVDLLGSYSNVHGGEHVCTDFPPSGATWGPWTTGLPGNCFDMHEFAPFYQDTAELRFHNADGSRVIWNLGFYHWNYFWGSWWPFQGITGPTGGTTYATQTNAVYGEVTYPVTQRLRLIAGARESFDSRRQNFGPNGSVPTPTVGIKLHHFDYRAGMEYDLTRHSMEYLTVATGYRPGGLNEYLPELQQATTFGNEVNTAIELGTKNSFLDDRLQWNFDLFYYIQKGYQDHDRYNSPTDTVLINGQEIVCNATNVNYYAECQTPTFGLNAHVKGLETQIRYNLTTHDHFELSATALDAHFDESQTEPCAVLGAPSTPGCWDGYNPEGGPLADSAAFFNIAGDVEPHSPRFSGDVRYEHIFTLVSGQTVTVGGEGFYTSGYYTNPIEDAYAWQNAYWLGNFTASYTPAQGDWMLSAFVRNVTNYAVKTSVLPATTIGDPRTVGLTISTRW